MTVSGDGLNIIKQFEGLRLNAYLDSVGVPTIGYGSTMWSDGSKVKLGQKISLNDAEKLLLWEVNNKTKSINSLISPATLNQNQFDALASFTYNLGVGALSTSTLLKKVKKSPNDLTIRDEFMKWINAGGKPLEGLRRRRSLEADLYFKN